MDYYFFVHIYILVKLLLLIILMEFKQLIRQ
jgi:hypothetical protein